MSFTAFNKDLADFLDAAVTPFHAVAEMAKRLSTAGFTALDMSAKWQLEKGGAYYLTHNDSSIVAFVLGKSGAPGLRMMGAHTDSPCLKVKPNPVLKHKGYWQLGVEVYGGALLNPWYDRDLSLAGRVNFTDASDQLCSALINFAKPIAIVPSLAIHLDRTVNEGRKINKQTDIVPLLGIGESAPSFEALIKNQLAAQYPEQTVGKVLESELFFYDTQGAATVGLKGEFFASARLDNLLSCYVDLQALLKADRNHSALMVCNDHEEVGSVSSSGAQGPLLERVLRRIAGDEAAYARLIEHSLMVSTDNAHGIHPNYADKHDGNHGPMLNAGPVIKINANQRYATNSESAALFRLFCEKAKVPVQSFVVRTDMACGSTIGPLTAGELGVRTVDVGVPTFAMHSIRELAGSEDAASLCKVLTEFVNWPDSLSPQKIA
ncbi:MAG: M18 family aminopeptidase [Gammaproteobacteria bacterium]|nr:MAG: M18 family aminopeptidase [Gammaproteobacteria bacterium]